MSGNLRAPQKLWDAAVVNAADGGSKATLNVNPSGTDNDLLFTAVAVGAAGNAVTITFVKDHANGGENIVVVGSAITFHIAMDNTTTANAILALVSGSVPAGLLVTAALGQSDISGTGVLTAAIGKQALAGGTNSLASLGGNIGPATNVALFLKASGQATFKLQASASEAPSSGRNGISEDDADWYDYLRAEALDENEATLVRSTLVFSGADAISVDLSPFAPTFLRLVCTDSNNADVTVTAFSVSVG